MAGQSAIADVGQTLVHLLQSNMTDLSDDSVVLCSPVDAEDAGASLSLFLYQVAENEHLKNREMPPVDSQIQYPPLALDLFYMVTAYSQIQNSPMDETVEEHTILGQAMRVLYDNGILRGSALRGSLAGTDEELRIVLAIMSMDSITQMWNSFENQAYRPSAFYQVTPVAIDSRRQSDVQRVIEEEVEYYRTMTRRENP